MSMVINTNVSSINAQRNLVQGNRNLATTMERLSTGLRINSAKDDAAGLAISERMTGQIRGMNQSVRNTNDGISLMQTAEGALNEVSNNLQRIRELAVQSANASNNSEDRAALNAEVTALKDEIDRVANQTQFNGVNLLDGSFSSAVFQVGANSGQTITVGSLTDANLAALGNVTSASAQGGVVTTAITDLGAQAAGSITINGTDIGAIAAAGTTQERVGQVVDAINNVSTSTGVNAHFDTATARIVMTSGADITVGGTDDGTGTSLDGATGITATASSVTGLTTMSVDSYAGADLAIQQVDSALQMINSDRADMGALQTRFESVVATLQTSAESLSAARSRIQDADFASETANLTRSQIMQQAGTAMLAQANQAPQSVLSLLR